MSFPPHICLVSATSKVSYDDLQLIASAIDKELIAFCDVWDLELWRCDAVHSLTPAHARVSKVVLTIKDETSVPDALGWHTEEDGTIFGEIAAADILASGGKVYSQGSYPSVAAVIAHEVFETVVNPHVNLWVDRGDGRTEDAREVCDAVQGASYTVPMRSRNGATRNVEICNYLLPAWFDAQALAGPYDKLGLCSEPFEVLSTGYHVTRVTGPEKVSNGASLPATDPAPIEDLIAVLETIAEGNTPLVSDPFAMTPPEPVEVVTQLVGIGSPGIQARALTKRRPRALHGLGPAFRAPQAPPSPTPVVEDDAPAPSPDPSTLELAPTEPSPPPAASVEPLDVLPDTTPEG